MKIGILISGRGSNMVALVDAVQSGEIPSSEVAVVISDKADAGGLAKAQERGVETVVVERNGRKRAEHDAEIIAELQNRGIELVCLAGYMRLLSPSFVQAFPNRIINIHPSLLPAFPGLDAQKQAFEAGVPVTGCTVHYVDELLDHGEVILQREIARLPEDTVETLSARILEQEHRSYVEAVKLLVLGLTDDYFPTEAWLEQVNEELRKRDVPHKQRPWEAWHEWSEIVGLSTSLGDEDIKTIFKWFEANTKEDSQNLGSAYVGSLYYDSCFWPVFIPVVFGTVRLDALKSLATMPETIKSRLKSQPEAFMEFVAIWADSVDYGFGIEDLIRTSTNRTFAEELFRSGNQQLNAAVTLLHEDIPNPRSLESSRMATEMFLKAYLALKGGLTEKEARQKPLSHDIDEALSRCLQLDPNSELQEARGLFGCFPDIADRYKGTNRESSEMWQGFKIAQFVGTTVVRSVTSRDIRKTIKIGGLQ